MYDTGNCINKKSNTKPIYILSDRSVLECIGYVSPNSTNKATPQTYSNYCSAPTLHSTAEGASPLICTLQTALLHSQRQFHSLYTNTDRFQLSKAPVRQLAVGPDFIPL